MMTTTVLFIPFIDNHYIVPMVFVSNYQIIYIWGKGLFFPNVAR